jgi:hypothetical protein
MKTLVLASPFKEPGHFYPWGDYRLAVSMKVCWCVGIFWGEHLGRHFEKRMDKILPGSLKDASQSVERDNLAYTKLPRLYNVPN